MHYFGLPSSDDSFSSAFDKSTGFRFRRGVGFAGLGVWLRPACANASSFFSSTFGAAAGAATLGSATVAACGNVSRSRTFSVAGFGFRAAAQICGHARAGLRAAGFLRRARLLHHVEKIAFEILRRIVHAHFAGRQRPGE